MLKITESTPVRVTPNTVAALATSLEALEALRSSLARMLETQADIRRAADVEKVLGLDRTLAWRVFRTATATDAAQTLQNLPSIAQFKKTTVAARKCGIDPKLINDIDEALLRFEEEIKIVADDRDSFGTLLSGHVKGGLAPMEQRIRKAAFKTNAHLWREQCRTASFLLVNVPNVDGLTFDVITVRGWVDLYVSRRKPTALLRSGFSRGEMNNPDIQEAIKRNNAAPLEMISGFTSAAAELSTGETDGIQETHIRLPGVGREGRVSVFVRQRIDKSSLLNDTLRMSYLVSRAAEVLHIDMLVPCGWSDAEKARALGFAHPHRPQRALEHRDEDEISVYEEVTFIPDVGNVPHTSDVPRWPDVVRHVLEERGWWGRRFEMYRLRIPYPMMYACLGIEVQPRTSG